MKTISFVVCMLLWVASALAADTTIDLVLLDGSKLKGRVVSSSASDVTLMSEAGVFRIPFDKLTPESRQAAMAGTKPDSDALLRRIAELEAKVAQLQQENEALRRQVVQKPAPGRSPGASSSGLLTPASSQLAPGGSHVISSTGKRHNSGCRYFGTGMPCGPTDGVACKICGG